MRNAASALVTRWSTRVNGAAKGHASRARRVPGKKPHPRGRGRFGQHRNGRVLPHRALESPLLGSNGADGSNERAPKLIPLYEGAGIEDKNIKGRVVRYYPESGEVFEANIFDRRPELSYGTGAITRLCRDQSNAETRRQMGYLCITAKRRDIRSCSMQIKRPNCGTECSMKAGSPCNTMRERSVPSGTNQGFVGDPATA
jgi:hypothetical protein